MKMSRNRILKPSLRSVEERNKLVEQWSGLPDHALTDTPVGRVAAKLLGHDEARQEGFVALLRAAELYDPTRKIDKPSSVHHGKVTQFHSYALRAINNKLIACTTQNSGGIIQRPHNYYKVDKTTGEKTPTCQQEIKTKRLCDLNDKIAGEEAKSYEETTYEPSSTTDLGAELDRREMARVLKNLVFGCLTPRERLVVYLRFFLGFTLRDVGKILGVSRQWIKVEEMGVLAHLKRLLKNGSLHFN